MTEKQPRKRLLKRVDSEEVSDERTQVNKTQKDTKFHACDLLINAQPLSHSHWCVFLLIHLHSCHLTILLGPKSTMKKGKSSTRPTTIKADDESSSTSSDMYESDNNCGKSESKDSNHEESDVEDEDDDFGMRRMTEGEVQQMFEVKVMFSNFYIHPTLCADSTFRCLRIQLLFLMMMTTLKWPASSLTTVDMGQVQKLRVPQHRNQMEYLMSMRTMMNFQPTFQPL